MTEPCPECGTPAPWTRVECTLEKTCRSFKCACGEKFARTEPPHPPAFFNGHLDT